MQKNPSSIEKIEWSLFFFILVLFLLVIGLTSYNRFKIKAKVQKIKTEFSERGQLPQMPKF